jgi:hypothetical protein
MSKLYSAFLVVASLFTMAALGAVILAAITNITHLAASAGQHYGMTR